MWDVVSGSGVLGKYGVEKRFSWGHIERSRYVREKGEECNRCEEAGVRRMGCWGGLGLGRTDHL